MAIYKEIFSNKLDQLYKIRSLIHNKDNKKLNETIEYLENLINSQDNEIPEFEFLEEFLNKEALVAAEYKQYFEILKNFLNTPDINCKLKELSMPYLSDEELLMLIHDLFKNYMNDHFYNIFLEDFKLRSELVHILSNNCKLAHPETIHLEFQNENHIILPKNNNIYDVANLAHEYGHVIQFKMNIHKNIFNSLSIFSEIISIFFELLMEDYLCELKEFKQIASIDRKINYICKYDNIYCTYELFKLYCYWGYINKKNNLNKAKILFERKFNKIAKLILIDDINNLIFEENNLESLEYALSYILAIELFMLYKKDPELGLYKLEKLINLSLNQKRDKYYQEILNLGIIPNDNIEQYREYIINPK